MLILVLNNSCEMNVEWLKCDSPAFRKNSENKRHPRDANVRGAWDSGAKIEGRQISRRSEFSYQRQENRAQSIKLSFIKQWNESMDFKKLGVTLVRVNLAFINPFRKWILQFANCIQSWMSVILCGKKPEGAQKCQSFTAGFTPSKQIWLFLWAYWKYSSQSSPVHRAVHSPATWWAKQVFLDLLSNG